MQIYHVEESFENRHEMDPVHGMRLVKVQTLKRSDAARVTHPELGTFDIEPDGTFIVPDEVGRYFVGRPGWHEGPSPFEAKDLPKSKARAKSSD